MKKTIITIVVIAAIAASVGGYYYTRPGPEPKVSTAQVTRGDVTETVRATGTLDAVTAVTVGSQVGGIIQEIPVDFNSIVRKSQVLLRINPDAINTQIEQAKATLVQREADLERNKVSLEDSRVKLKRTTGLFQKSLATQADLDSAEVAVKSAEASLRSSNAALTQAQANLNQQEVNLAHTIIQSPIDGIIIQRAVDVGQTVQANYQSPTLFIVAADLTRMKCTANIDESEVGKIRPGQVARLTFDAYPGETFEGKVVQVRLQPITVQNVVSYGTVIEVPNSDYKLKPGMTATVSVEINKKTNVVRVPATAVRFRPTEEIFAAFNQPVPPEMQQRGGQRGGGTRMAGGVPGGSGAPATGQAPAGQTPPRAGQAPAAGGQAPAGGGQPGQTAQNQARGENARPSERGGGDRGGGGQPGFTPGPGGPGQGGPGQGGRQFAGAPGAPGGPGGQGAQGAFGPGGQPGGQRGQGGGQRGQGDPNDPEARARMVERYNQMPDDQKAQFASRMKERGIDIEALAKGAKPGAAGGRAAAGAAPAAGAAATGGSSAMLTQTTVDALFGPLQVRTTRGSAWLWLASQKQLKSVNLRLGITDGQWFELLEGELQPGTELVTAVTLASAANQAGAGTAGNPLMQNRGMMGGPPGGFGGPGGGGGRGR
jgi:HlyD family secretion protein